ncbi:MFS transporter [Sphingobacterium spiritivorum]|nr:MFS transporter [Sphingobacterium spiritivorum]QQT34596.1 MFS transporter [Sphingobacterium spiritivorum]WQD35476.1 MFS transporter [Sphingobacterium spiritivorum]SUJ00503.1 Inner membrane transport protein ynfM [Sphingobacterium spiritivorum]
MSINTKPLLTPSLLWLMAIGSGLVVANNYYNQPLLALMAKDFNVSEASISNIAMLTQIGYACGLLFIVPLGDMVRRRNLILIDFIFIIASLIGMAMTKSVDWLFPLSFMVGFTSVVPQIFVPMAAELASPDKRSSAIGMVMSGLLIGILLSRVVSGIIGDYFGWREMYWAAAGCMVVLSILIAVKLPENSPSFTGSYMDLMKSLGRLTRTQPVLRLAAFRGAMGFAGFSAFWTTLVFHMEGAPFHDGPAVVGSFGLVGAAGALGAAFVGRFTGRFTSFQIILYAIIMMIVSWIVFYFGGYTYGGLIIGIILVDLGLQSMHIMNQSSYFALNLGANNRLNTVYMVSYFIGGSTGTYLAAQAWNYQQWTGVVAVGIFFTALALAAHLIFDKKINNKTV